MFDPNNKKYIKIITALATTLILLGAGIFFVFKTPQNSIQGPLNLIWAENFLSDLKVAGERLSLVNIWATWCEPCLEEIPDLIRLENEFKSHGVKLYFISMDDPGTGPQIYDFIENLGYLKPLALVKHPQDTHFLSTLLGESPLAILPQTLVFDKSGHLIDLWVGIKTYEEMSLEVRELLE